MAIGLGSRVSEDHVVGEVGGCWERWVVAWGEEVLSLLLQKGTNMYKLQGDVEPRETCNETESFLGCNFTISNLRLGFGSM